jgi:hypothetical protein
MFAARSAHNTNDGKLPMGSKAFAGRREEASRD